MALKKPLVLTNGKTKQISTGDAIEVASGGTGVVTIPSGQYVKGAGTSPVTSSATIPNTDITGLGTMSTQNASSVAITGGSITGLSSPVNPSDAVTKAYADALKAGLDIKDSVRLATTANINLATGTLLTIDGVVTIAGNRVLVKDQTTASQNGIYVVSAGAWTRATDADADVEVTSGLYTFVSEGTTWASTGFVLTTADPIVVGTTALSFTQFSGAGQIVAGDGLTKTGNTLHVGGTAGVIVVGADSINLESIVIAGTYDTVTVDTYGRVNSGLTLVAGSGLTRTASTFDVVGTAGRIVANADSIDLATAGTAGTYDNVTTDAYGRVTSGAAITAGAGLVRTGNDIAVGTASATRIVVNANDVDLATTGVSAGTFNSVTVDTYGRVTAGSNTAAATTVLANADTYTNASGFNAIQKLSPVYSFGGANTVISARADSTATSDVIGLATALVGTNASGSFITSGSITGTTGEWDNIVTGQTGGLTPGSTYYVDPNADGRITSTIPTTVGHVIAPVGIATSTTRLNVRIMPTIEL